jgi:hypothetical protein
MWISPTRVVAAAGQWGSGAVGQWGNEVDAATGLRLGDFFAELVATESAANALGADGLARWRPPAKTSRRRGSRRT